MGIPMRKTDRRYTYRDYKDWPDDERWELIDGTAWNMSPAPGRRHQAISRELLTEISLSLRDKECAVYQAPFDVLLPDSADQVDDDVATVVQPDIVVVCDPGKLTDAGCTGAPDWIIEILSPYTAKKDMDTKFELYQRHRVEEYWIVDPGNRFVHRYVTGEDGEYPEVPEIYRPGDTIESAVVKGLSIDLETAFAE